MKMERKRSSIKSCAFWWKPSDPSQISRPHFQPPSETSVISRPLLLMVHTNNLKSQWPPTANICFPHSQVDWAALLQALDWPDSGQFPLASYFGTSCQAAQPNKQAHSGFCSAQVYKHSIGQSGRKQAHMINANTEREGEKGVRIDNPIYHNSSLTKPEGRETAPKLVNAVYTGWLSRAQNRTQEGRGVWRGKQRHLCKITWVTSLR